MVAIADVELHDEVTATIAEFAEHLPDRYASTELSQEGVEHLCLAFPIRTVRGVSRGAKGKKRKVFHCIGGVRTYQIAKTRLPPETRIRILVQDEADPDIGPAALRELFTGAVVFGVRSARSASQLEALRKAVPTGLLRRFFPRITSRTAMTHAFGFGRSALSSRDDEAETE